MILSDPSARPVIGHRGNRAFAPENTIESFAQAVTLGADAIELDVHMSADGIPVVHHDPTLSRTTDGVGEIARMTFAELRRADAGAQFSSDGGRTFPYRGAGHRIPSLEEVVEAFPSTPLLIEIKAPLAATGVRKIIESRKADDRTLVDSYHYDALRVFEGSAIATGASRRGISRLTWEVLSGRVISPMRYAALCVPLSQYGIPLPVKRFAKAASALGRCVHVWTINDPKVASDLWAAGVNGIITDDPATMLRERRKIIGDAKRRTEDA